MAGTDGMQKMLPESPPRRKKTLHPLCALNAFSCNKLLLFVYALMYLFVGIVMTAIGVLVEMHRTRIASLDNHLALPTALLIFVGLVIAINALLGLVGTIMERPTLLKFFLVTTVLCFLVQVAIGIIAFIYREEISETTSKDYLDAIRDYPSKTKTGVDWLQDKYECCGFSSYMDYRDKNSVYGCRSGKQEACGVPKSCCQKREGVVLPESCGYGIHENSTVRTMALMYDLINTEGCTNHLIGWLIEHLDLVGAVALGFAIPQIFGILLSYYFLRKVQEHRIWYRVDNFRT